MICRKCLIYESDPIDPIVATYPNMKMPTIAGHRVKDAATRLKGLSDDNGILCFFIIFWLVIVILDVEFSIGMKSKY